MSSQQRLNGPTRTVADELLLLRKLATLRRSASWQRVVQRAREPAKPASAPSPRIKDTDRTSNGR
jgi:hypothetical protein